MKKLLVLAALMSATAANAKTTTEYYLQPGAGGSALTLDYNMGSATVKSASDVETKATSGLFDINYAYGLNDTMAFGFHTDTGSVKTEVASTSTTASGLGDLHAYMAGFSDMIHYGVDLGLNTAKSKSDNRSSGGLSLMGHVGVLSSSGAWNFGGDLAYTLPMERTTDNSGTESKVTGGNEMKLAGFAEYNYGMGFIVGELSHNTLAESTTKTGATESKSKADSALGLSVKGTYDINEMATAFAGIAMYNVGSNDDHKAYSSNVITLGAHLFF